MKRYIKSDITIIDDNPTQTARTLTFEVIADDRFDDDIKSTIEMMIDDIKTNLDKLQGVYYKVGKPYRCTFPDNEQYRAEFLVQKDTKKVTWDDIMREINKVKAPFYKYMTLKKLY